MLGLWKVSALGDGVLLSMRVDLRPLRIMSYASAGALVASVSVAGTALALSSFPRNLSGIWHAPDIGIVTVVHDPDTGKATFVVPIADPRLPDDVVFTFSGPLYHSGVGRYAGATHFTFLGTADPYAFRHGGAICEAKYAGFDLTGSLLGQVGSREIATDSCGYNFQVTCKKGGSIEDMFNVNTRCDGTWQ